MNKIKTLGKNLSLSLFFLIISTFILSIFSYFNLLNGKIITIIQMVLCFISIFIASFKQGICSTKRGYLEGLKIGMIFLIIIIIINLLFYRLFHFKNYIYYLLILSVSAFGGMIGISRKKNN